MTNDKQDEMAEWVDTKIKEMLPILRNAHFSNLVVRINGETRTYEADWIKYALERLEER